MPLKLTSREYKIILIGVLVAAASLAIGVKYFSRAFPEAAIDFRVNRDDSMPVAEKFLAARGVNLAGYRHAATFDFDDEAKTYLERTQGLARMNGLTRGPIHLWRWSHRWFRPQQKEEFRADVAPSGEVVGFDHEIAEAAPGANLEQSAARALAEKFLVEVMHRDLSDLEFVEADTEKRPARTDHTFTWKQKSVPLGDGSLRVEVEVDGDQVAGYREFVKVPEQWSRDYSKLRSRNVAAQLVDQILWVLLSLAMLVLLTQRLRDRDVPLRLSLGFGAVAGVLYFLGQLNSFSQAQFNYSTTDSYSSFVSSYVLQNLLASFGLATAIFLLVASSEPIYREGFPNLLSLRRYFSWQGLRTRSFFIANVVGIALTFFFFAYQTVFYLAADKLGAWAPADVPFSDLLNTRIPWVTVLFIGFFPAVSEETQFRAFAIPWFRKILRSVPAAVILPAFIWGFLHSAYPNQPFFIRGVEVGLGGIIIGFIMLRFGILATLIWHYSVDALYTAFLLLRSPNHYLMISGGLSAGIMLVPLIVALVAYWRSGTFTEETPLTNASEGISRPPRKEEAKAEVAVAYQPLSQGRVTVAGVLTLVFIAVALVPVKRFGEGIALRIVRPQAIHAADDYLRQRGVNPATYHHAAWVQENVDGMAVRYLLQHASLESTDQIYRQSTRLGLWHVRYFRPLEKEEYVVFVDPTSGQVFGFEHILDDNAPGASLAPEQARTLAAQALQQYGYRLDDFDLQNSEAEKKKAREDYRLTWQARPGDPRNVADAHYRLTVDIAGDQVVGFARSFKLPEEWMRQRQASGLVNAVLVGLDVIFVMFAVGGAIFLLVKQVRGDGLPWRRALKAGVGIAVFLFLAQADLYPLLLSRYITSIPLATFQVYLAVTMVLVPLMAGGLVWVLVALLASVYPQVWGIFARSARRAWRRDAALALVVGVAAGVALSRFDALFTARFHAYAPVSLDLFPNNLNAYLPGAGFFLRGLAWGIVYAALVGLVFYAVRLGLSRRAWWLWTGIILLLIDLGPSSAHSLGEFLAAWVQSFVPLVVAVAIVALFFRDNVLAYFVAAVCLPLVEPLVTLFSAPAPFFRGNGFLLAALLALLLGWLFLPTGESSSSSSASS